MKILNVHKTLLLEFTCFLYVLLFVYAAVSKLLVFDEFKIQMGQSPALTIYADWLVWTVPCLEILISFLLTIPKYRLLGLYAAYTLMVMFTAYIIVILNFSDHIPCSCGGVLENLNWTEHLIFNIVFVLLAFIAILMWRNKNSSSQYYETLQEL